MSEKLAPCVAVAVRAMALVIAEPDRERRAALAKVGSRRIRAAIEADRRKAEAEKALEDAMQKLGGR